MLTPLQGLHLLRMMFPSGKVYVLKGRIYHFSLRKQFIIDGDHSLQSLPVNTLSGLN